MMLEDLIEIIHELNTRHSFILRNKPLEDEHYSGQEFCVKMWAKVICAHNTLFCNNNRKNYFSQVLHLINLTMGCL